MNESPETEVREQWIVRFNGHPVQFTRRCSGLVYSICHLDDATKFGSFIEAADTVVFSDIVGHKAEITINPVRGEPVPA